eukprot:TRINITY_DN2388_c2_g1_i2.p2 TRINITY_DN2388_c2_g1~~TRINITY_DN2388_c2_g1_i2.p2  ORF type:complete len:111 (-),score=12.83 TRINITY_DN2388_c2_g1_i2:167-460(-)
MADCILSYALTRIVEILCNKKRPTTPSKKTSFNSSNQDVLNHNDRYDMMQRLYDDEKMAGQFLVLAHLYAQTDSASLTYLCCKCLRAHGGCLGTRSR